MSNRIFTSDSVTKDIRIKSAIRFLMRNLTHIENDKIARVAVKLSYHRDGSYHGEITTFTYADNRYCRGTIKKRLY